MPSVNDDDAEWPGVALKHLSSLYGFAVTLTRNKPEAEDLVQETYTRAFSSRHKLAPDSNVKGWLFIILRNTWLKQNRHLKNGPTFVQFYENSTESWLSDSSNDPLDECIRLWEGREIRAAFQRLPHDSREIIILRDIEGFTYQEISEILDCPMGTIMSRLSRARNRLKQLLVNQDLSTNNLEFGNSKGNEKGNKN